MFALFGWLLNMRLRERERKAAVEIGDSWKTV